MAVSLCLRRNLAGKFSCYCGKFSGENLRGSGEFVDVAGNNLSRWCKNLVHKWQKQRINIGKFGDISLAFVKERKNEPKLKSGKFV